MKNYKEVEITKTELEVESIECDRCETVLSEDDYGCCGIPHFHLSYLGGYNSEYPGDLIQIECDLCEECLEEMFGDIVRVTKGVIVNRADV